MYIQYALYVIKCFHVVCDAHCTLWVICILCIHCMLCIQCYIHVSHCILYIHWMSCIHCMSSAVPKALWKWGYISTFFLFFLPISESGGVTKKPTNWSIFLCDISIFEYKVWTKKVFKFHTFCRQLYFFYSISPKFFWWRFFLLNLPFFLLLKIFLPS